MQETIARFGLESRPRLRKFLVAVIGCSILLIGLVMVVLPGPALLVMPIGFAILATEFAWARRVWRRGKILIARARGGGRTRAQAQAQNTAL